MSRSALSITHTAADGTLLDGTTRGDGTAPLLKEHRWRWSGNLGCWYVPQSRDRPPRTAVITATATALEQAGFTVTTDIDASSRPAEQVEADRAARQQGRVDALTDKAARRSAIATAAEEKATALAGRLPLGQPILIGHHSEGAMRRHFDRVDSSTRAYIQADEDARATAARAETASHTTELRHSPRTVSRRIERLSAEQRALQRSIDSYSPPSDGASAAPDAHVPRLATRNEELLNQIAYWTRWRTEQIAAGDVVKYSRETISADDLIRYMGDWRTVKRVNPKSVTLEWGTWSPTVPYGDIEDHRRAASTS
jgi:hypothetical protein